LENLDEREAKFITRLLEEFTSEDQRVRRHLMTGGLIIQVRADGRPMFIPSVPLTPILQHHHD
jgi:hypothetical protein